MAGFLICGCREGKLMISILCVYKRTVFRDEKTGFTIFSVETDSDEVPKSGSGGTVCKGNVARFPPGIPIRVNGELNTNDDGAYIKVISCVPETEKISAGISFLSGGEFPGIGIKKAEKIMNKAGNDLFAFCKNEEAKHILTEDGTLTQEEAEKVVARVNGYSAMQEVFTWISKYGGTCEDAEQIYDIYGNDSIEKIRSSPYFSGLYCMKYSTREAIGRERSVRTHDGKRIKSLVREAFRIAEGSGSTCVTMKMLLRICSGIETSANMGYRTLPICIAAYVMEDTKNYKIVEWEGTVYIYRKLIFDEEARAASHVKRIMRSGQEEYDEGSIEEIEKELGIQYNEEQKEAVALAGKTGIVLLTGGPGTGKSTTIKGMISYFRQIRPEGKIALCAPTGSAAKRIRELTGDDAETIHRLMEVRPFDNGMLACRDEYNQLPYDMIIADEFSMTDTELFMMFMSGVKNGALVVLAGDDDQLSSVGPGNVFHDMIESGLFRTCRLTKVYRQDGGSSILKNAEKIRNGRTDLIEDKNTEIIYVDTDEEAEKTVLDIASEDFGNDSVRLYTPVRNPAYRIGKTNMNMMMRDIKRKDRPENEPKLVYGGVVFSEGDPIIMCRNNYRTGYMNGDEGYVWKVHETGDGRKYLEVNIDNDLKVISGGDLDDIDLAYALTTHKSQGSECDISIIIVPEKPAGMLIRNLIYVAATRARKKNIFVVQKRRSLEKAITTDGRPRRITGLKYMLTH